MGEEQLTHLPEEPLQSTYDLSIIHLHQDAQRIKQQPEQLFIENIAPYLGITPCNPLESKIHPNVPPIPGEILNYSLHKQPRILALEVIPQQIEYLHGIVLDCFEPECIGLHLHNCRRQPVMHSIEVLVHMGIVIGCNDLRYILVGVGVGVVRQHGLFLEEIGEGVEGLCKFGWASKPMSLQYFIFPRSNSLLILLLPLSILELVAQLPIILDSERLVVAFRLYNFRHQQRNNVQLDQIKYRDGYSLNLQQIIIIYIYRMRKDQARSGGRESHHRESRQSYSKHPPSQSRSRSRDDAKSKFSQSSQKSNRSGPVVFGGNTTIRKTQKVQDQTSEILSRAQFKKPHNKVKNIRDRDLDDQYAAWAWQQAEKAMEQEWYQQQENVYDQQQERNKMKLYQTQKSKNLQAQLQMRMKSQSKQRNQHKYEQLAKWQENQLVNSGVYKIVGNTIDGDQNEENRVMLMVHDLKPPFLDGNTKYTNQISQIQVVKDMMSDMAILAKKGSVVVKEFRERVERGKIKEKEEREGDRLKKLIDKNFVNPTKEVQPQKQTTEGEADYRDGAKFSALLTANKHVAATDFSRNKTLKQQREMLPVFQVRDEIRRVIRENKVVIIVGETGSGKTTQMTQYLLQDGYGNNGLIGCTQPRRVAAVSVAKRVSEEMGVQLGSTVGYSIRFEDCTSSHTLIKYMTDGVLLRQSLNDSQLQMYSAIIMDEAHERSLNTDVLFGILKKVAQKRRDIKIIITSATMNAEKFSNFFGDAPIFLIPGRIFPVQKYFEKAAVNDYVDAAVKKAVAIHIQQPPGDILIFMTGQQDIECTCKLIQEKLATLQNAPKLLILPIYSQLRSEEQAKIFESSQLRKCIVATNIAQTSLTLDGVKYVIDTGFCKLKVYNPKIGMDALQITPISQANANQRAGRAGRTGPGHCYRLYSAHIFREELFQNNIPQIQRTNLCNVVLLLKSLNIENLLEFEFMDPPPQDTILNSMYQLWILGALDNLGNLTPLGRKMAQFPVDPPLSKMIIVANDLGCLDEVVTIVSMLSVPSIFYKPKDQLTQAQSAREKLLIPQSDHLTYLNIFQQWKKHNYSTEWCTQHFLQFKSLRKVREVRSQLMDIAKQLGFKATTCQYNYDLVRKAICSGYFINASKVKGIRDYVNMRTGVPCQLHMSSALLCLGYIPQYVVYHQLVMTSKQYMNCVTTVDPHWLAELGPMFFSVKGESSQNKSKAQLQKQGESLMFRQLQDAKKKKIELQAKRVLQDEKERIDRIMKTQYVVQAGKNNQKIIPPTPKPASQSTKYSIRREIEQEL